MRPGGALPPRCVKCNEPALQPMVTRKIYWHNPTWEPILLFIDVFLFFIVALILRNKAEVTFGVCAWHRLRRRLFIALAWSGVFLGLAMATAGGALTAIGILLIPAAILIGVAGGELVYAADVTETEVRLGGCGQAFLDSIESS